MTKRCTCGDIVHYLRVNRIGLCGANVVIICLPYGLIIAFVEGWSGYFLALCRLDRLRLPSLIIAIFAMPLWQ